MLRDGEMFAKTALLLEVRRYQVKILTEIIKDARVSVPKEIEEVVKELDAMDKIDPGDQVDDYYEEADTMNNSLPINNMQSHPE